MSVTNYNISAKVTQPKLKVNLGFNVIGKEVHITKELLKSLDADFVAENIKEGVELFGLIGTLKVQS